MNVRWEHVAAIVVIWWIWVQYNKSRGHDRAPVIQDGKSASQPDKFDSIFGIGKKKETGMNEIGSIKSRLLTLEMRVSNLTDISHSNNKNFDRISRLAKYTPNIGDSIHMNSK